MTDIALKSLFARLNRALTRALEGAAGACVSRGNHEVTVEHLLAAVLDDASGDLPLILAQHAVDAGRLRRAVQATIDALRTGNAGRPVFSPLLIEWLKSAWMIASLEFGHGDLRSGVLFIALLGESDRFAGGDWIELLRALPRHEIGKALPVLVAKSAEETRFAPAPGGGGSGGGSVGGSGGGKTGPAGDSALARFCTDFTAKAREGRIDPVFGRDAEIRQIVDILARRRKNNPICVGEPGVGKTAVVEGLALRVVEGDVPAILTGVRIVGLDLGLLQAGASVKGEFENRLKAVLDEVKASPTPVVLFIDEAHTLIGAGGQAGGGDAANLLKPALARGEMKTIAATTWAEYKKYFEKDAALARRFQLVKLDEPSVSTTHTMLRGLRAAYETAHGVIIRDDALKAAAEMGARYIPGRQHPDKGIDLVDTAAARVKVALTSKPAVLQDVERRIQDRERARGALARDRATGGGDGDTAAAIAALDGDLASDAAERARLTTQWQAEKTAADAAIAARQALIAAAAPPVAGATTAADAAALRADFDAKLAVLRALQGAHPLIHIEVTPTVISQVVADWTGVPVGSMLKDEAAALLRFEADLATRIKGQDHVLSVIGTGIRAAKAGVKDPRTPLGIFLLVGPSGVGKTETALGVADLLFGGERFMTAINMSEYQEKHTVSRLVGSPPGYVGYGEGGVLTEAVRQRPYSVVLLDEVEKADLEVMNLFYQVFDKGTLSDGEGREIDFRNTVIFLTSNLATDVIVAACSPGGPGGGAHRTNSKSPSGAGIIGPAPAEMGDDPEMPALDDLVAAIRPQLIRHFKPALLARMTIVPFFPIGQDALKDIARLKLHRLRERLSATHKVDLVIDDAVITAIAARCTEVETGARNVDHIIAGNLLPSISTAILERLGAGTLPGRLAIGLDGQGGFTIAFAGPVTDAVAAKTTAGLG